MLVSLNLSALAEQTETQGTLVFRENSTIDRAQYVNELMTIAYRKIGYRIRHVPIPLKRSLVVSNQGITDGEWIRIEGIEQDYTNLIPIPYVLFDFELDLLINDQLCSGCEIADINTVAYVRGIVASEKALQQYHLSPQAIDLQSLTALVDFFKMGRTQAIIADTADMQGISLSGMQVTRHKIMSVRDFHYLHKKNKHLIKPLTNSLFELERDGTAEQLRHKYGIQPTQHQLSN